MRYQNIKADGTSEEFLNSFGEDITINADGEVTGTLNFVEGNGREGGYFLPITITGSVTKDSVAYVETTAGTVKGPDNKKFNKVTANATPDFTFLKTITQDMIDAGTIDIYVYADDATATAGIAEGKDAIAKFTLNLSGVKLAEPGYTVSHER